VRAADEVAHGHAERAPHQVVQGQVNARLGARVAPVVNAVHGVFAVEGVEADDLRPQVVVNRRLHLLECLAEEADIHGRLACAGKTLVGLDANEQVLEDRARPLG